MATYLADKSAWTRRDTRPEVRDVFEPLLLAGRIASCGIIDLELLYSAESKKIYKELAMLLGSISRAAITQTVVDRALAVQGLLADKSQHRSVSLPDLLVSACAETNGLIVLHYDADFDRIARVTGQTVQWIVPQGTVA